MIGNLFSAVFGPWHIRIYECSDTYSVFAALFPHSLSVSVSDAGGCWMLLCCRQDDECLGEPAEERLAEGERARRRVGRWLLCKEVGEESDKLRGQRTQAGHWSGSYAPGYCEGWTYSTATQRYGELLCSSIQHYIKGVMQIPLSRGLHCGMLPNVL